MSDFKRPPLCTPNLEYKRDLAIKWVHLTMAETIGLINNALRTFSRVSKGTGMVESVRSIKGPPNQPDILRIRWRCLVPVANKLCHIDKRFARIPPQPFYEDDDPEPELKVKADTTEPATPAAMDDSDAPPPTS